MKILKQIIETFKDYYSFNMQYYNIRKSVKAKNAIIAGIDFKVHIKNATKNDKT